MMDDPVALNLVAAGIGEEGVERLLEKERTLGDKITFADIAPEVAGVYPAIMKEGKMDAGGWSCGMVVGLIHDVPTVAELIQRIMGEADAIIRGRLDRFASTGAGTSRTLAKA